MAHKSEGGRAKAANEEWNNLDVSASTGLFELSPTSIKEGQDSDVSSLYFPETRTTEKHSTSRTSSSAESSHNEPLQDAEHSRSLTSDISDLEEGYRTGARKKSSRSQSLPEILTVGVSLGTRSRDREESGTSADETARQTAPKRGGRGGARRPRRVASQPVLQAVLEDVALEGSLPQGKRVAPAVAPVQPPAPTRGRRRKSTTNISATMVEVPLETPGPSQEQTQLSPKKPKVRRVRKVEAPSKAVVEQPAPPHEKTLESLTVACEKNLRRRTFVVSIDVNVKTVPGCGGHIPETNEQPLELLPEQPLEVVVENVSPDSVSVLQNTVGDQTMVKPKVEPNTSASDTTMNIVRSKKGKKSRSHDRSSRRRSRRRSPRSSESSSEESSCSCSECMSSCSCSSCQSSGTEFTPSSCSCSDCTSDTPPRRRLRK